MRFALVAVLLLAVLGAAGVLGLAIFSDLPPPRREISAPVAPR